MGNSKLGKNAPPPVCTMSFFLLNFFFLSASFRKISTYLRKHFFSRDFNGTLPSKIFSAHSQIHLIKLGLARRNNRTRCWLSSKYKARKKSASFFGTGHFLHFGIRAFFLARKQPAVNENREKCLRESGILPVSLVSSL